MMLMIAKTPFGLLTAVLATVVSVQTGPDSDEQLDIFKTAFALYQDHV